MTKIHVSSDYSKFEPLPFNRDVRRLKTLEQSMRAYGWVDAFPMYVEPQKNGKLLIKAGNRRFTIAKKHNIPVKFVILDIPISVFELERANIPWSPQDYLSGYVREGKRPAYLSVKQYHIRTGIPLSLCISILAGETAGSSNKTEAFKLGIYELGDPHHALMIEDIVQFLKRECNFPSATTTPFVTGLSRICWVSEFSGKQFIEKAKRHTQLLEKKRYRDDYIKMIETIYNRNSQSKIPLEFLAAEVAQKRKISLIEKKQKKAKNNLGHGSSLADGNEGCEVGGA